MPDLHEFTTSKGKSGIRDANLDKGWLLQKPTAVKPSCIYCGLWHDNQEEINQCQIKREQDTEHWLQVTLKEKPQPDDRLSNLENEMSEIKTILKQLVGGK